MAVRPGTPDVVYALTTATSIVPLRANLAAASRDSTWKRTEAFKARRARIG